MINPIINNVQQLVVLVQQLFGVVLFCEDGFYSGQSGTFGRVTIEDITQFSTSRPSMVLVVEPHRRDTMCDQQSIFMFYHGDNEQNTKTFHSLYASTRETFPTWMDY